MIVPTRHPWRALLAAGVVWVLAAGLTTQLEFGASVVALLPDDAPELAGRAELLEQVRGATDLVLSVSGGDAEARRAFLEQAAPALSASEAVRSVAPGLPAEFFQGRWLRLASEAKLGAVREALRTVADRPLDVVIGEVFTPFASPVWRLRVALGELASELPAAPGGGSFLLIQPAGALGELDEMKATMDAIRQVVPGLPVDGMTVDLVGRMPVVLEENARLQSDFGRAGALAAAGVLLLLLLARRRADTVWLVGAPLVLGVTVTLGVTAVTVGRLNVVSAFMVPALLGLGADFCVHLLARFDEEGDAAAAARGAFRPCATSALTTAAAFGALLISDFPGIREFGLIAAYGVLITFACTFWVLPALLALRPPRAAPVRTPPRIGPVAALSTAAVAVLLAGAGAGLAPELEFRNDLAELRGDLASADAYDRVGRALGGPIDPTLFMVDDSAAAGRLADLLRRHASQHPPGDPAGFGAVLALQDLLPKAPAPAAAAVAAAAQDVAETYGSWVPDRHADALARLTAGAGGPDWSDRDLPASIQDRLRTKDGARQLVLLRKRQDFSSDTETFRWADRIAQALREAEADGVQATVLDESRIVAAMYRLMAKDFGVMVAAAAAIALLLVLVAYRRPGRVLALGGAVAGGVALTLGALAALEVDLNFFNVVVLPTLVGMAIDNAVHLLDALADRGLPALGQVLATRGRAALLASATTALGFGSMLTAQHPGAWSLGLVAVVGVLATTLLTTIALPLAVASARAHPARTAATLTAALAAGWAIGAAARPDPPSVEDPVAALLSELPADTQVAFATPSPRTLAKRLAALHGRLDGQVVGLPAAVDQIQAWLGFDPTQLDQVAAQGVDVDSAAVAPLGLPRSSERLPADLFQFARRDLPPDRIAELLARTPDGGVLAAGLVLDDHALRIDVLAHFAPGIPPAQALPASLPWLAAFMLGAWEQPVVASVVTGADGPELDITHDSEDPDLIASLTARPAALVAETPKLRLAPQFARPMLLADSLDARFGLTPTGFAGSMGVKLSRPSKP